ncbi:dephospho-CoA kinase [Jatrophihabitans sp. DSM 45814]
MKFVGLSGGIGSGKSEVGRRLALKGAEVIDVDQLSRELQQPGQPLFDQIVERWGVDILDESGYLDRAALARVVFHDKAQLAEITAMVAPITENEIVRRALLHQGSDDVVIMESAMGNQRMYGQEGLIVTVAPVEIAVSRLVTHRGMNAEDARARVALQLPPEQRVAHADFVIDNAGDLPELDGQVERAWQWIQQTADATPRVERAAQRQT